MWPLAAGGKESKGGEGAEGFDLRALHETASTQPAARADGAQFAAQAREAVAQAAAMREPAIEAVTTQVKAATAEVTQAAAAASGDRLPALNGVDEVVQHLPLRGGGELRLVLPARVGTQAWNEQVGQKIVWMVGKEQAATLTLNPPDLGPLQVVLSVTNDQASVAFSANQLEVRQALENALPRLREMMSESGIALGNATVDSGSRQAQDGERRGNGDNARGFGDAAGTAEAEPRVAARTTVLGERGMVDTFA